MDASLTRPFLFPEYDTARPPVRERRKADQWLAVDGITLHNLADVDVMIPLGTLVAVTGVSGSGKSTLVSRVLHDVVRDYLHPESDESNAGGLAASAGDAVDGASEAVAADARADELAIKQATGLEHVDRLVRVDQKPIGRTPRSNLATYTGLFDAVRTAFARTDLARERGYTPSRFSFNVPGGRCETCLGEGFVSVELLFLPGSYGRCPTCLGARYNPETLEVTYDGKSIADVLGLTVEQAAEFLGAIPAASRSLKALLDVGLGYLRLGQPATELSGGEAQRIKLATELQRVRRGHTLYLLDEPTTGLHPADVRRLLAQLHALVDAGDTVVVVEHEMDVIADADWVIDLGPSGGDAGGRIIAEGKPETVAASANSRTAPYLAARLSH